MPSLQLKVPPPLVLVICAALMWVLSVYFPINQAPQLRVLIATVLVIAGLLCAVSGILSFRRAATTVDPTAPHKATTLVIVGVYKLTRNPMYLGLLLILLAWSVFLFNLYSALILIVFVLYMTQFQIKPEEKALTALFGEEYLAYKRTVRRWI